MCSPWLYRMVDKLPVVHAALQGKKKKTPGGEARGSFFG
jgi:hypothetical protein